MIENGYKEETHLTIQLILTRQAVKMEMEYRCEECSQFFSRIDSLKRHIQNVHKSEKNHQCSKCLKCFTRAPNRIHHEIRCTGQPLEQPSGSGIKRKVRRNEGETRNKNFKIYKTATAFKDAAVTFKLKFRDDEENNYHENIEDAVDAMKAKITANRERKKAIKVSMSLHLIFEKATNPEETTSPPVVLPTEQFEIFGDTSVKGTLVMFKKQLLNRIELYEGCGSGWILSRLVALDTTIWQLDPLRAFSTFHSLPKWIRDKKAVVNVKNKDVQCFKWSILAAFHYEEVPRNHRGITYSYTKFDDGRYDFSMLTFPVNIKDIEKFERKNNMSINVYGVDKKNKEEEGVIYPLKVTNKEVPERHVNLLLTENRDGVLHYSAITNFSALLNTQYNKEMHKHFYCYTCLQGFKRKTGEETREQCTRLVNHRKYCKTHKPQRTEFPQGEDTKLHFTHISKQLKAPFVAYCDFECLLEKNEEVGDCWKTGIEHEPVEKKKKKEVAYQEHKAASFAYKIVSIDPNFEHKIVVVEGENAAEKFLDSIQGQARKIFYDYIYKPKPKPVLTAEEEEAFHMATSCHICNKDFLRARPHCHNEDETSCVICQDNSKADVIAQDHCHILGNFRGAAHQSCNLNYRIDPSQWRLPCYFHNLRGYDGHLIIKALQECHGKVNVVPTNMEKYLSISIDSVQFLDSMQFTGGASLDQLAKTLADDEFHHLREEFGDDAEKFALIKKKGIFPYDYFDSFEKFEARELPPIDQFFNSLNDRECSAKDYEFAQLVWKTFDCQTFKDYHNIYLKGDVLLLADFFEKFRMTCLNNYGLDAAHYYSTPGLAWDAALKMTNVELELFDNEEMYTFMERSIRGGISVISKRHAKANNPGCKQFDPLQDLSWLIYLDANNLYGWAMSQPLPTHGFRWLSENDFPQQILNLREDASDGYIFEVDLEYPSELHTVHNDYPLAPERLEIDHDMLSPFQKSHFPLQKGVEVKLAPNLRNKENYVVHYRNLQFYLEQGLKLTKIHRVLAFKQSAWLKQYIDYNTTCRTIATSKFEKDYYKLMNNAVFGKTQENLRNRVKVEVIPCREIALKRVAKPNFERSQIVRDDLVIIQTKQPTLMLNKPVYVGFSVLELSKLLMFRFHYEKMLRKYGENIALCFTDTDSLLYHIIQDGSIYDDMQDDDDYDFSEYAFDHPLYNPKNKKVIGKMKDELNGIILEDFLGLRSKCYSLLFNGLVDENRLIDLEQREKQKTKGIKKNVKSAHLRHAHFKSVLEQLKTIVIKQNVIKSRAHTISTYHQTKVALSAFDTKRWIKDDNINTNAFGHYNNV